MADISTAASHPPKAQQNITESINGALLVKIGSFIVTSKPEIYDV
jgi:hypothetical protein